MLTAKQTQRFLKFFANESAGGLVMLLAAAAALLVANGPLADWYAEFVARPLAVSFGSLHAENTLNHVVNDILMVFFFLLVGLELKREMCEGVLTDRQQILLPLFAAIGGMVAPALIFLGLNRTLPAHWDGWAIPSATDIAFAVCVLMLAARHAPPALKIFLLAIAIFDDLGAILIIAGFYSDAPAPSELFPVIGCIALLYGLNRLRVEMLAPYFLVGIGLWFALHGAGIHTTIGGVLVGVSIPMRSRDLHRTPLNHCMHHLHPWVSFCILPLFAFVTAGLPLHDLRLETLRDPLTLGIMAGLFLGKQVGIFGVSWLLIRLKLATLPHGVRWVELYAVALLAGIGFTMSLFIGQLAFDDAALQAQMKLGVLGGSLLAALSGALLLRAAGRTRITDARKTSK